MLHPVDEQHAHALHGRAREVAVLHRLAHALVNGGPVAVGDDAADDLVHELVAELASVLGGQRLDADRAVAELAAPAGLLLVPVARGRFLPNRLLVRHARRVQLDVDVEAAVQPVDRHLDLHLREAGEELLARLLVPAHLQRRVLLRKTSQSRGHLLLVALRLGRDREAHHRLREVDVRRLDGDLVVDEHVAGDDVLQLRDGAEVADAERLRRRAVLSVQEQDLTEALLGMRARVDERRVARDRAGEDAEAADAPRERIGDRLEDEHGLLRIAELDGRALARRRRDTLDEQVE